MPVGVFRAAVTSTEGGDGIGPRGDALDGANSEGKQAADRETMVYEGSVRSGQQVGGNAAGLSRLVLFRLGCLVSPCLALSRLVSPCVVV